MNIGRYLRGEDRHIGTARQSQELPKPSREDIAKLAREASASGDGTELSGDAIERFAELVQAHANVVSTNNYVQPVPDHCDRIMWRGGYYHLPLSPAPVGEAVAGLTYEVRCYCSGDEAWSNWAPVTEAKALEYKNYDHYQVRKIASHTAQAPAGDPAYWTYLINGTHRGLGTTCPPEDAYDEGTLVALYTAKPDQSARIAELEKKLKHSGLAAFCEARRVDEQDKEIAVLRRQLAEAQAREKELIAAYNGVIERSKKATWTGRALYTFQEQREAGIRLSLALEACASADFSALSAVIEQAKAEAREEMKERCALEADHWQKLGNPNHKCGEYISAAIRAIPDTPQVEKSVHGEELPGMWEASDLAGGATDCVARTEKGGEA